jgi:hypothetical protein
MKQPKWQQVTFGWITMWHMANYNATKWWHVELFLTTMLTISQIINLPNWPTISQFKWWQVEGGGNTKHCPIWLPIKLMLWWKDQSKALT